MRCTITRAQWHLFIGIFFIMAWVSRCHEGKTTHTHTFNGPFSGTTRVSRYQKGKTDRDFTEARDSEWLWRQLGHVQVCISLQTDKHVSTPPLKFFYRPDALPAAQATVSKHWRQRGKTIQYLMRCWGLGWQWHWQWHWLDHTTICKQSAPHFRQITTPTPHHSIFTSLILFLMPPSMSKH